MRQPEPFIISVIIGGADIENIKEPTVTKAAASERCRSKY